ncbi:acyl-CoA N-acyltransferase [Pisolithus croceorrhizus]|nr:acyl-CoA N-acyltransferase [Pisolithus croceorrhizus]
MAEIVYRQYIGESDLPHIMSLVQTELSEPYVIYTYRYFLHQWPQLAFLAIPAGSSVPIGVIVCKQSMHKHIANRGYIAMLSVNKSWRQRGVASTLVRRSIEVMKQHGVDEASAPRDLRIIELTFIHHLNKIFLFSTLMITTTHTPHVRGQNLKYHGNLITGHQVVLETEYDNIAALALYESLGFIREKRLYRFYLNGKDAFRLVLPIPPDEDQDTPLPYHSHRQPIRTSPFAYVIDEDEDDD